MGKRQRNLKDSINRAMKTPVSTRKDINKEFNPDTESRFSPESEGIEEVDDRSRRKQLDKPLKIFGAICLAVSILTFVFTGSSTVDTSESAKNALKNKVSTGISAGTVLMSEDENIGAKDYTVTHKSQTKDTKIWVWDYAAEDGDYVQVLVNGAPVGEGFMIKHKPREIVVPALGKVQIKGIKDGGGGITYAVRYEVNGTSYFNGTPEGEFNTYTLTTD